MLHASIICDTVVDSMTVWVVDTELETGLDVQGAAQQAEGCERGWEAALGSLLYMRTDRTRDDRD